MYSLGGTVSLAGPHRVLLGAVAIPNVVPPGLEGAVSLPNVVTPGLWETGCMVNVLPPVPWARAT